MALTKFDIRNAYNCKMVPVHPADRRLLGMSWQGQVDMEWSWHDGEYSNQLTGEISIRCIWKLGMLSLHFIRGLIFNGVASGMGDDSQ